MLLSLSSLRGAPCNVEGVVPQVFRQELVKLMDEPIELVLRRPEYPTEVVRALGPAKHGLPKSLLMKLVYGS